MKSFLVWTLVLLAVNLCRSDTNLGTQVEIYDFPSVAQVEMRVGFMWVQQCACSILTSRHVLSKASCFFGPLYLTENRRIRAGTSYRSEGGRVVAVDREFNHPDFDYQGGRDSDISVIRLDTPLVLDGPIQQGSILGPGISLPAALPIVMAGWGNTAQGAQGNTTVDNNLYSLDLYTHNFNTCVDLYSNTTYPANITSNMFCAGLNTTTGRNFDARDAGAPLFYQNVVVGLVSFGASELNNTLPLVIVAVSSFTEWIVATAVF